MKKNNIGKSCLVKGMRIWKTDNPPLDSKYPFVIVGYSTSEYQITDWNGKDVWTVPDRQIIIKP